VQLSGKYSANFEPLVTSLHLFVHCHCNYLKLLTTLYTVYRGGMNTNVFFVMNSYVDLHRRFSFGGGFETSFLVNKHCD